MQSKFNADKTISKPFGAVTFNPAWHGQLHGLQINKNTLISYCHSFCRILGRFASTWIQTLWILTFPD